jgi:hypothetical protein
MKTAIVIIHVAAAAVLLGTSLGWGRLLRQAAESGQSAARVAVDDVMRRTKLARVASALTLLSGLALIFVGGGFAVVPKNFHIALTVMLATLGWVVLGLVPRVKALAAQVGAADFNRAGFEAAIGKVGMATGIVHGAWLIVLVLMFVIL